MPVVFVAGATGYLGHYLCSEYQKRGWIVRALARNKMAAIHSGLIADDIIEADATSPDTLKGVMDGADLVVSSLGITRQKDGMGYKDVDYQANANLLKEALSAGVGHFAYIHVLNADKMAGVALIDAKQKFAAELQSAGIASTVIAPSGYFSDMADFLTMAKSNRVWLFGDGALRINPIHGADLAAACADAIEAKKDWLDVGGPDILSHRQIAELAFEALDKPVKITCLPDWIRRGALWAVRHLAPKSVKGPVEFFLSAFGHDMVGEQRGDRQLREHFRSLSD